MIDMNFVGIKMQDGIPTIAAHFDRAGTFLFLDLRPAFAGGE
jgi:hypothetical protein